MLEIVKQTINGLTQLPQEYVFPTVTFHPGSIGDSDSNSSIVSTIILPLSKTMAKPQYVLYYIDANASTGTDEHFYSFNPFTSNGISDDFAYAGNDYGTTQNFNGNYLGSLNTSSDTTVTIRTAFDDKRANAGDVQPKIAFNDYSLYDYSNNPGNIVIRYKNTDNDTLSTACPDPVSDFDTYGDGEFTAGEYSDTSNWSSGTISKINDVEKTLQGNVTYIVEMSSLSVNNSKAILLFTNVSVNSKRDNNTNTFNSYVYVWNFTTSDWDNFAVQTSGYNYNSGASTTPIQTNGGVTNVILTPTGSENWSNGKYSDYISNGKIYYGGKTGSSPSSSDDRGDLGFVFNYLGIGYINGSIWS